tara:strand:- start:381 stop:854 length:474 start_codon:yes stop_codon:yes gene_type:complete
MSKYLDFDNYLIFKEGAVFSIKRNIFMKTSIGKHGYCYISLCKNGKHKTFNIHRLVALVYIPNPLNKKEVNHIDGNKLNNNIDNLEWNTPSENQCNINDKIQVNNTSGKRGVNKQGNSWKSELYKNGKRYCKYFKIKEDAINYRRELEKLHFKINLN